MQETCRDCIWTEGGLGPRTCSWGQCPGKLLLSMTRALPFENTETEQAGPVLEGELLVRGLQGRQQQAARPPTCPPSVSEPRVPSEEAGAPQAVGLAQVG